MRQLSNPMEHTALPTVPVKEQGMASAPDGVLTAYQCELDYVCRSLMRLGVREADVEDVAHEVFLVLFRRWETYDQARALRPFLFGIALRVAAAHRRRFGRELVCEVPDVPDPARSAEQAVSKDQARALVQSALERLPLSRRAVLIMYELDEIPMVTIARTLEIPLFTAYSRLRKARKEFEKSVSQVRTRVKP